MKIQTKQLWSVKVLSLLLPVIILAGVLGIADIGVLNVNAATSSNYTYEVLSDNTIKIVEYKDRKGNTIAVIPSEIDGKKVTVIGDHAFFCSYNLTSIIIPDTVTTIEDSAMAYCENLTNVTIGSGVKTIGEWVLSNCASLISVTLPANVTTLEGQFLSGCNSLQAINVSNKNENYSSVNGVLFNKDKTILLQCPGGISGSYTVPNGVTKINEYAFDDCSKLTSIVVSDSVTEIEQYAFYYSRSLTSITISSSVKKIDGSAFERCDSLKSIDVSELNQNYSSLDGVLFNKNKTTLFRYPCGKKGNYTIPYGVMEINYGAFRFCNSIRNIIVPTTVTEIKESTFSYCDNIANVYIPKNVTTIHSWAFRDSNATICGYAGSYAETFAAENSLPFSEIEFIKNNSTVTETSVLIGEDITLRGVATGGIGGYQYGMFVKHSTDSAYTTIKDFSSTSTYVWSTYKPGTYNILIRIKDAQGNMATKNFTITVVDTLKNSSTVSNTQIILGETITLKGVAIDGKGNYQYAMFAKHSTDSTETTLKNFDSVSTIEWKPSKIGIYNVTIAVTDSTGALVTRTFTVTVNDTLKNTSTVTASNIVYGQGITLKGSATGGIGSYQYKMNVKHSTDSGYTNLKDFDSTATKYWTPAKTGTYYVVIIVKDSSVRISQKNFTITVTKAELKNTSVISTTSITKGSTVKVTGKATGGTAPYKYEYYYKKSTASKWEYAGTGASVTIKPYYTGTYTVRVKMKDADGTIIRKDFKVTVNPIVLSNTSTINTTSITKGNSVKVTGKAIGGTSPYKYYYYYKRSTASKWEYGGTGSSATIKPYYTGTYIVRVKAIDAKNAVSRKDFTITVNG